MTTFMQTYARTIYQWLEYIFLPPRCAFCLCDMPTSEQYLCQRCFKKIKPIVSYALPITKQYHVQVIALSAYVDPVRFFIVAKHGQQRRASKILGALLAQHLRTYEQQYDIVVPVPLHWTRYARRGYNQAEVIGSIIADAYGATCVSLLVRRRMTAPQAGLAPFKRVTNLKDAFQLHVHNLDAYKDKHILLVDDVMTTGVTLSEAVKQLRLLKPASITIAVAARVV